MGKMHRFCKITNFSDMGNQLRSVGGRDICSERHADARLSHNQQGCIFVSQMCTKIFNKEEMRERGRKKRFFSDNYHF